MNLINDKCFSNNFIDYYLFASELVVDFSEDVFLSILPNRYSFTDYYKEVFPRDTTGLAAVPYEFF